MTLADICFISGLVLVNLIGGFACFLVYDIQRRQAKGEL